MGLHATVPQPDWQHAIPAGRSVDARCRCAGTPPMDREEESAADQGGCFGLDAIFLHEITHAQDCMEVHAPAVKSFEIDAPEGR